MRRLEKIEHHEEKHKNIVMISWILGNTCNYKCSYCPPELNSGSDKWVPKETVFEFVERVIDHYKDQDKTLYFEFSGGEVTRDKEFIEIAQWLKERGCWVGMLSNGSRSLEYWEELMPHLDHVCFSYHAESNNSEHFTKLVDMVHTNVTTHVTIVMHKDRFQECEEIGLNIAKRIKNSSLSFQPVMKTLGVDTDMVDYTSEQLERIKELDANIKIIWDKEVRTYRGMLDCTFDDGAVEQISATNLFAEELTGFSGWECAAGQELLTIFYNGDIYPCWGKEGEKSGKIGNVHDEQIAFPDKPCMCDVPVCFDICDIMTTRRRCN